MFKNKILVTAIFVLGLLLSGTKMGFAQEKSSAPLAPSPKIVKAIEIRGNKSIGIAQVLARIKTRVGEE